MKTYHFIIATLIVFASCTKEDFATPTFTHQQQDGPTTDSIKWNLNVKIPQLGIEEYNVKPYLIHNLMGMENNQEVCIGRFVQFYDDNGYLYEFAYEFGKGVTGGGGRIEGKSYILNIESNTINLCNWYQNVSITYDPISPETINH